MKALSSNSVMLRDAEGGWRGHYLFLLRGSPASPFAVVEVRGREREQRFVVFVGRSAAHDGDKKELSNDTFDE